MHRRGIINPFCIRAMMVLIQPLPHCHHLQTRTVGPCYRGHKKEQSAGPRQSLCAAAPFE